MAFVDPDSVKPAGQVQSGFVDPDAPRQPQKQEQPNLFHAILGNVPSGATNETLPYGEGWKRYGQGLVNDQANFLKAIVNPQTYRNIASELSPAAWERTAARRSMGAASDIGGLMAGVEPQRQVDKDQLVGLVSMLNPVTRGTAAARAAMFPGRVKPPVNEALKETINIAQKYGLKVPRADVSGSPGAQLTQRVGGKEAIEAATRIQNQPIVNKLAAKALGLADDTPLTAETLSALRESAGKAYKPLSGLGAMKADAKYVQSLRDIAKEYSGASKDFPALASEKVSKLVRGMMRRNISSEGAVEQVKNLRRSSIINMKSLTPSDRLLGQAEHAAAEALDDLLGRVASTRIGDAPFQAYKAARQLIAKTHSVDRALNPATGNVVLGDLTAQLRKGVPLSGELKDLAMFGRGFQRLSKEQMTAPPGGGLFEPLVYSAVGKTMFGDAGAASAAFPIIGKPIARYLGSTVPSTKVPKITGFSPVSDFGLRVTGSAMTNKRERK